MWGCVIRFWAMGTCILSLARKALPFLSGFGEARGPQSLARALKSKVAGPKESLNSDIFRCIWRRLWRQVLGEEEC